MRNLKISLLLFYFLLSINLHADEDHVELPSISDVSGDDHNPLADLEGEPSSIVGGCVNVITGNYFESSVDLVINGNDPLYFERSYDSGDEFSGSLYFGWNHNLSGVLKWDYSEKHCHALMKGLGKGGLPFKVKTEFRTGEERLNLDEDVLRRGMTNCRHGSSSHRANPQHAMIFLNKTTAELWESDGTKHQFTQDKKKTLEIARTLKPNRNQISYVHRDSKTPGIGWVDEIYRQDNAGNALSSLSIRYPRRATFEKAHLNDRLQPVSMESSDGRKVTWWFEVHKANWGHEKKGWRRLLVKADRPNAPEERYFYDDACSQHFERLIRKERPDGRFREISYYQSYLDKVVDKGIVKGDIEYKRVREIRAPLGFDGAALPALRFRYKYVGREKKFATAEVRNSLNHKASYLWSTKTQRLVSISQFLGKENYTPYKTESFTWGNPKTQEQANLIRRAISDGKGDVWVQKCFEYDKKGNVIQECIKGNLTGTKQPKTKVKGLTFCDDTESCYKTFAYTKDGKNLISEINDNGVICLMAYHKGTNLLRKKLISDQGTIKGREFWEYDYIGAVTQHIQDNGSGTKRDSLKEVTTRKITYFKNNAQGLPEEVTKKFLDLQTGQEKQLSRVVNSYDSYGRVIRKDFYDARNQFNYSCLYQYNQFGLITYETDPLGRAIAREYDNNGNLISVIGPDSALKQEFIYDRCNRIICEKEQWADGRVFAKKFIYDTEGNKISSIDEYGAATDYEYDELNREIAKKEPAYIDAAGALVRPIIRKEYDILGNLACLIDPNGIRTEYKNTIRGKPYLIIYPDGTQEKNEYTLKGELACNIARDGKKTSYTYDYLSRPTKVETYSATGDLVKTIWKTYDHFHLLSEKDTAGLEIIYSYDGAGRLIAKNQNGHLIEYEYDHLGREAVIKDFNGHGDAIIKKRTFDFLDQILSETLEDIHGNVLNRKSYAYDIFGNQTEITSHNQAGVSIEYSEYNPKKEKILEIDPCGNLTRFYSYYDYIDQKIAATVPCFETIDPKGIATMVIKYSNGKDHIILKKNPYGDVVSKIEYALDCCGNVAKIIDFVIDGNTKERAIETILQYNCMSQLVKQVEAFGQIEQKTTCFAYNNKGQLEQKIKNDGVAINHTYDAMGRLWHYYSSDQSFSYEYSYDCNDNPICVRDFLLETCIKREYDHNNLVTKEVQASGLEIKYTYDHFGRCKQIWLPDSSVTHYSYYASRLKSVMRFSADRSYGFKILEYDMSGNPLKFELPGNAGITQHSYDLNNRLVKIENKAWKETDITYDPAGQLISYCLCDAAGEVPCQYKYDDLYQVIGEEGVETHTYVNDSYNNQIIKDGEERRFNDLHQLLKAGKREYVYDANGNTTKQSDGVEEITYTYDALDRLIAVSNKSQKFCYKYDAFNRRYCKEEYGQSTKGDWEVSARQFFLYIGLDEIASVNEEGIFNELRVMSSKGFVFGMELQGKVYGVVQDHNKNVRVLISADTGVAQETYRYSAFGVEHAFDCAGQRIEETANPWRYSCKRLDKETGFIYFGQRYYDPSCSRWVTPDPIGREGGPNLYAYVLNNPLILIDRYGESPFETVVQFAKYAAMTCLQAYAEVWGDGLRMDYWADLQFEQPGSSLSFAYEHPCEYQGEEDRQATFMNGLNNNIVEAFGNAKHLSNLLKKPLIHQYNATHGFWDIFEVMLNIAGIATDPTNILIRSWEEYFEKHPNGRILQFCHSQGAAHVRNALMKWNNDNKYRIEVVAIAPVTLIEFTLCADAHNYESEMDCVTNVSGRRRYNKDVKLEILKPKNNWFFDHDFRSETYEGVIKKHGNDFFRRAA